MIQFLKDHMPGAKTRRRIDRLEHELNRRMAGAWDRIDRLETRIEPPKPTLYCSFCGKSQHDIIKLIAGPKVFICNECVDLCNGILDEDRPVQMRVRRP